MATAPLSAAENLDLVASILAMREHADARLHGIDARLSRVTSDAGPRKTGRPGRRRHSSSSTRS